MRAMRAESFTGYGGLKLVEVPRPRGAEGRVLVRVTATGVSTHQSCKSLSIPALRDGAAGLASPERPLLQGSGAGGERCSGSPSTTTPSP